MKPGGVVVFNTFNRQPSTAPAVKQYEIDGVQFVEASWMTDDNMVQHVQMREGEPPHTTRFRWIPEKDFKEWLGPYFSMCEIRDGASSVWCCTRNL